MLIKATIFFTTKITLSSPWFMAIVIVIVAIMSIIALVVFIATIILPKSTIYKVLNIGSIVIIMYHNK